MRERLKKELYEFAALMRSLPAAATALFMLSVLAMNLLANKSIDLGLDFLALDCGIFVSWFAFLTMDLVTKRFGPKAATELSVLAILVNLLFCLIFYIISVVPGSWSQSYVPGSEDVIGEALDKTFGGTWYVVLGSTAAFAASAVINNFTNFWVGRAFGNASDGRAAYFVRSYVSTAVGQFADNIIFAFCVSYFFFGWTATQCAMCALTGMLAELAVQAAFSYPGLLVCERWKRTGVGSEYLALVAAPAPDNGADGTEA